LNGFDATTLVGELTSRGESSRGTGSGKEGEDDRCEELHGKVLVVLVVNRNCNCDANEKDTQQDGTNVSRSFSLLLHVYGWQCLEVVRTSD
jgi:hypothetical protein